MIARKVHTKWTKPTGPLRPTASKNWPFHSLSRTCPSMLAIVTTIEVTKIANTRRPPCARRSTRANKLRSRTRLKSCWGAAATSSTKAGLSAATGIIATIGGTGVSGLGVSSGGAREAKIGKVDFKVRLHSPPMAHYVEYLPSDSVP